MWTLNPGAFEYAGSMSLLSWTRFCLVYQHSFLSVAFGVQCRYVLDVVSFILIILEDCLPPSGQFSADQKLIFETVAARGPESTGLETWTSRITDYVILKSIFNVFYTYMICIYIYINRYMYMDTFCANGNYTVVQPYMTHIK